MRTLTQTALTLALLSAATFGHAQSDTPEKESVVKAGEIKQAEHFHDADPRNTQTTVGLATDDNGDMKLAFGGGGANLYGGGKYQTQNILYAEYLTQSEQLRIRAVNFDERFGGIYVDLAFQDIIDMYTVGYMVPIQAVDSRLLFFPSLNYTRVEFDTEQAADQVIDINGGPIIIDGTEYGRDAIADIIKNLGLHGKDSSDLLSLNVYAMMPWNETHYTMMQVTSGSSYGGFDMQMVDLYFMQGVRGNLGKVTANIYLEARHTKSTIQGIDISDDVIGVGVNLKL